MWYSVCSTVILMPFISLFIRHYPVKWSKSVMLPLEKRIHLNISKYFQSSDWVERLANRIVSKIVNEKKSSKSRKKALVSNRKPIHMIVKYHATRMSYKYMYYTRQRSMTFQQNRSISNCQHCERRLIILFCEVSNNNVNLLFFLVNTHVNRQPTHIHQIAHVKIVLEQAARMRMRTKIGIDKQNSCQLPFHRGTIHYPKPTDMQKSKLLTFLFPWNDSAFFSTIIFPIHIIAIERKRRRPWMSIKKGTKLVYKIWLRVP